MPRRKKPPKVAPIPPSVREDPAKLDQDAAAPPDGAEPTAPGQDAERPRRGRPPGSKTKTAPASMDLDYPIESLAILHQQVWDAISNMMRSRYQLSDDGAREMATWANQCLKQYLSPHLAEYTALAGYLMSQFAAIAAVLAMRVPKTVNPEPAAPTNE